MDDITIIMMTPNRVPKQWAAFHKEKLMEAIGNTPIITVSKEPLDWGTNLLQTEYGYPNLYKQMLRAAKVATTKYIGIADDDTLYPKSHFQFRPKEDGFYYNFNRWHMVTYGKPLYFYKPRPGNGCMIATRESVIEAMGRRVAENPDLPGYFTRELGTSKRMRKYDVLEAKEFYTDESILSITHEFATDKNAKLHKKYIWPVRAYDIPLWGRAEDTVKKFV